MSCDNNLLTWILRTDTNQRKMGNCLRKCWFRGDYPCTVRNCCCCPLIYVTCCCCKDSMYETNAEYDKRKREKLQKQLDAQREQVIQTTSDAGSTTVVVVQQ